MYPHFIPDNWIWPQSDNYEMHNKYLLQKFSLFLLRSLTAEGDQNTSTQDTVSGVAVGGQLNVGRSADEDIGTLNWEWSGNRNSWAHSYWAGWHSIATVRNFIGQWHIDSQQLPEGG